MNYQFIKDNQSLKLFSDTLAGCKSFSLDTEFIRTRTYYPQLGLLQVYDGQQVTLIDPIAITDWQCFISAINSPDCAKYFHACSEDIDVFLHQFDLVPQPLFDSQILASFLDNPLSSGYATLVNKYLGISLDKSETRTDWLLRPLTEKQCHYAAADVYYLMPLMGKLLNEVSEKGWLDAAKEECEAVIKRKQIIVPVEDAYLNIKNAWQLNSKPLTFLQKLAQWRLTIARREDIAVNFVVHEEVLFKIASQQPKSLAELESLGMRGKEIRLYGQMVLEMVNSPLTELLPPIKRVVDCPNYKELGKKLKDIATQIAEKTGLSSEVLLSRRQINHYIQWLNQAEKNDSSEPELITGWRSKLFAPYLERL